MSKAQPRTQDASAKPTSGSRRRRMPAERPSHILSAALEAFVENGYAATRLEDVAERAQVSKGTLYLYFESKEALFQAVVRENVVRVIERGEQLMEEYQGSSADLLAELIRGWWSTMHEARLTGLPKLILSEASNFPDVAQFYFAEVVQRARRLFGRALERGIQRGEFRPVDVEYTVRVMTAPVVMALIWKHSMVKCGADQLDMDRQLEVLIDLVLHGLSHDAGKGRSS